MNSIIKQIGLLLLLSAFIGFMNSCSEDLDLKSFVPETPEYSFDKGEIPVPKEGGDFIVNVKSNLPWRAKTSTDWITLKAESGMGDGSFTFTTARNRTMEERIGEIIVWVTSNEQKIVKIIQAPSEASDLINHYYVKTTGTNTNDGLSWATATSLSNALDIMASGDYIHIAAGTYIPENMVSGGSQNADITFEIYDNVTLIGGYPADATDEAVSDPENNETILSGNFEFYHTVTVTAPVESGKKVTIQNISIKDGRAGSDAGVININGVGYRRAYGGGMMIGKSTVDVIGCKISGNETQSQHAAGVYVFAGANVQFTDTDITDNRCLGNGGGIFNESATVYMTNCNITGNVVHGVGGGIYTYSADTPTFLYLYNCTVAYNSNTATDTGRRGGGIYVREFSRVQIVNSTFYANESGRGGAISVYGVVGKEPSVDLINSTVFNNSAVMNAGGVELLYAPTKLKAYNSIISGNNAPVSPDIQTVANTTTHSYMAIGSQLLDASGVVVGGQTFDPTTMLGGFEDNGGRTKTIMLSTSSPAATFGMTSALLETLATEYTPAINLDIITKDQIGSSRSGKSAMGAIIPK